MQSPAVPTLEALALKAYESKLADTRAAERARRRTESERAMRILADWSGLPAEPVIAYPFKWQGQWFQPDSDVEAVGPSVEVYAWDTEDGWRWRVVRSLAEIGSLIADWLEMEEVDRRRIVRTMLETSDRELLPDYARALATPAQEA